MIQTRVVRITDLRFEPVRSGHTILTTLEGENPGGSIKDRMVYGELSELLHRREMVVGDPIAEISAGSTAVSLAYYCQLFQLRCRLFVPRNLDSALLSQLQSLGAEIHLADLETAYQKYDEFIARTGTRKLDQFGDLNLRRHYHRLGEELREFGKIDTLVGAVGTGHSLIGLSEALQAAQVISAEPCAAGQVSGIRNLRLESFADRDPCRGADFFRREIEEKDFFPDSTLETDQGLIKISDSFRVVLGAIAKLAQENQKERSYFALGAKNQRVALSETKSISS